VDGAGVARRDRVDGDEVIGPQALAAGHGGDDDHGVHPTWTADHDTNDAAVVVERVGLVAGVDRDGRRHRDQALVERGVVHRRAGEAVVADGVGVPRADVAADRRVVVALAGRIGVGVGHGGVSFGWFTRCRARWAGA